MSCSCSVRDIADISHIYIVFYKNDPELKQVRHDFNEETGIFSTYYCDMDNIWYYEQIPLSNLNKLRNYFIAAYKDNEFDDLHNSIRNFTSGVLLVI